MELSDDNKCFACGKLNPIGLRLEFEISDGGRKVKTECLPNEWFQGWSNTLHGGIIATILDETINRVGITIGGGVSLTAYLQVRFKKPAPLGKKLYVEAEAIKVRGRFVEAEARMYLGDGTVIAEAVGKCISLPSEG
jgi:acyl-coenzyme A thioesterase PaaI-like protein